MNEGFLGKQVLGGERVATSDHPVVLHHLPLSDSAKAAAIPVGTVMKRVEGSGGSAAWEPLLSSDGEAEPVAVVDTPCDPTGEDGELSALCVVHGCVKARLLTTGDNQSLTDIQVAQLAEHGIFAV
ncbi:MAG: hypothetical protein J1E80_06535 [Desulfovibrionaceae bacterium]|nr:hypothetical protein [Desulfovibrionaceae bacterium]